VTPEIYSKIVAKRPELAIEELKSIPYYERGNSRIPPSGYAWFLRGNLVEECFAHALIESHWLRKLELHQAVLKFGAGFGVGKMLENCVYELTTHIHETPLAALTEHFSKE